MKSKLTIYIELGGHHSGKYHIIIETFICADGYRTRLVDGKYTLEEAVAKKTELEAKMKEGEIK